MEQRNNNGNRGANKYGGFCRYILTIPVLLTAIIIGILCNKKHVSLDREYVKDLLLKRMNYVQKKSNVDFNSEFPLYGSISIVTGTTSGLGKEIARELYSFGSTVYITGRSVEKINDTIEEIKKSYPNSIGTLEVGILDTSDFDSVRDFVANYKLKYNSIDFLVNNAGIHYASYPGDYVINYHEEIKSKHGYDLAFTTNYMGHFLLTKLMLPLFLDTNGGTKSIVGRRILNVASSYHMGSDGTMLQVKAHNISTYHDVVPDAARSDILQYYHRKNSYSNNKLAQILHSNELQVRLNMDKSDLKVLSTCPNWVATNIFPKTAPGQFVYRNAFPVNAAVVGPLYALFSTDINGGEFVTNSKNFWSEQSWSPQLMGLVTKLGIRNLATDVLGMYLLMFQSYSYGPTISTASTESKDAKLAKELYDWTYDEFRRLGYLQ